ncbi:hypothetical protein EDEG_02183 [Edhazardia aedis USNM 41457]|uniref:Uncharacterized protein n=1 Tax=Edhazardia aedis (strain USNM 41457) TaxID=1003232 RepID=J9DQ64_EDHAE|nr:hypothetical protein EDEG_02183 [Edhazardia aedis USNM 41457]|eukprot:EJW03487.1 hypothetical protein EDEG_02183 [Edhazardia aedis USNM 41457]
MQFSEICNLLICVQDSSKIINKQKIVILFKTETATIYKDNMPQRNSIPMDFHLQALLLSLYPYLNIILIKNHPLCTAKLCVFKKLSYFMITYRNFEINYINQE